MYVSGISNSPNTYFSNNSFIRFSSNEIDLKPVRYRAFKFTCYVADACKRRHNATTGIPHQMRAAT